MTSSPDGLVGEEKPTNDLESAKFTKDKDTVDVVQPTAKLIGLTKEQLEQYRNDPFWKAVRYSLFIAFWLIWLAMFVGSILIVVLSDKCAEVKWTQKMTNYKIFTLAYNKASNNGNENVDDNYGNFAGIKEKLSDLKSHGISAIWPTPVLHFDKDALSPEAIISLKVSEEIGGEKEFKSLVENAHQKGLKVVVDLPVTVSGNITNWANGINGAKITGKDNIGLLKLDNGEVRSKLTNVVKNFIDYGVDAICITDYGLSTSFKPEPLIKDIRKLPRAEKLPIFVESGEVGDEIYQVLPLVGEETGKGLSALRAKLQESLKEADAMQQKLTDAIDKKIDVDGELKMWRLGSLEPDGRRVDDLIGGEIKSPDDKQRISALFTATQLFIPGPVSVLYGEELGLLSGTQKPDKKDRKANRMAYPWNSTVDSYVTPFFTFTQSNANSTFEKQKDDPNSPLNFFKAVAKLRQEHSFVLGKFTNSIDGSLSIHSVTYPKASGLFHALVINWGNTSTDFGYGQLTEELKGKSLGSVEVQASMDPKVNGKVDLNKDVSKISLAPYSALMLASEK